jgi:hypothetical protein
MKNSYIELCNGGLASTDFYNEILRRVHEVTASLEPEILYRLEDLYGEKAWGKLSAAERCVAENCMRHFALSQEVSMDYIGTGISNFALFKLA